MKVPDDLRSAVRIPLLLFSVLCSSGPPSHPNNVLKQEPGSHDSLRSVVRLDIAIGRTGEVTAIHVVSGPPALIPSALQAVQDHQYAPNFVNGQPVESSARIDVPVTDK